MALTTKEQGKDLDGLKALKDERIKAQSILDTLNYIDTYKDSLDSAGKPKKNKEKEVIQVIDVKSELRVFLESIGTSTNARSEVIRCTKKAHKDLALDVAQINALIAYNASLSESIPTSKKDDKKASAA